MRRCLDRRVGRYHRFQHDPVNLAPTQLRGLAPIRLARLVVNLCRLRLPALWVVLSTCSDALSGLPTNLLGDYRIQGHGLPKPVATRNGSRVRSVSNRTADRMGGSSSEDLPGRLASACVPGLERESSHCRRLRLGALVGHSTRTGGVRVCSHRIRGGKGPAGNVRNIGDHSGYCARRASLSSDSSRDSQTDRSLSRSSATGT